MRARLFVALWPPDHVTQALNDTLAGPRRTYGDVKWQPPDRWHITVAFLGDRDTDAQTTRMSRIPTQPSEAMALAGAGRFGRVLWVGVETGEWLDSLAATVSRAMHVDYRRFRGHLSVGRARSRSGQEQLVHAMSDLRGFRSPLWVPTELTLVRSVIGPHPQYEVISRSPLAPVGA